MVFQQKPQPKLKYQPPTSRWDLTFNPQVVTAPLRLPAQMPKVRFRVFIPRYWQRWEPTGGELDIQLDQSGSVAGSFFAQATFIFFTWNTMRERQMSHQRYPWNPGWPMICISRLWHCEPSRSEQYDQAPDNCHSTSAWPINTPHFSSDLVEGDSTQKLPRVYHL